MLKGFTHARLACGCRIGFREGVEGSPVTVIVDLKGPGCPLTLHVRDLPLFDHREALRPSTRLLPPIEEADAHPDLTRLRSELDALREEAAERAAELVGSEKFTLFMLDAAASAEKRVWREQGALDVAGAFDRSARELARESLAAALR